VRLDLGRRLKLAGLTAACRVLGTTAIHVVLEAIEVHGVRKYLRVWKRYEKEPLGAAVRGILEDEFRHEDVVVTGKGERRVGPERVRAGRCGREPPAVGARRGAGLFRRGHGAGLPVVFGATGMLPTVLTAGTMIVLVSALVAFVSGMDVRHRILLNLVVMGVAVAVTYTIGRLAKALLGVAV
jgi:VIT1/CCC1 family predicted Fe2+/Mn2+ transporter